MNLQTELAKIEGLTCGYNCSHFHVDILNSKKTCDILGLSREVYKNEPCHPNTLKLLNAIVARKYQPVLKTVTA